MRARILTFLFLLVCFTTYGQSLKKVNPDTAIQGQAFEVTVTGENTDFLQGSTTLTFKQGSETMTPNNGMLEILSTTKLDATIDILSNATGNWTAIVDGLTLENALDVTFIEMIADAPANVAMNDTFNVNVEMTEIPQDFQFVSADFLLNYNDNVLNFVDVVQAGTLSENGAVNTSQPSSGKLDVAYMNSELITGSGLFMKLRFEAVQEGSSSFSFAESYLNETLNQHHTGSSVSVNYYELAKADVTYSDNDGIVKESDVITITANFSTALQADPPLKIEIAGANNVGPKAMTRIDGTTYSYQHTVGNGNGQANVSFSNAIDVNGNEVVTEPNAGGSFTVDNAAPSATLTYSPTGPYGIDEQVAITAQTDEPLSSSQPLHLELSGANTTEPMVMQRQAGTSYALDYIVTNGVGDVTVRLSNGIDAAGNEIQHTPAQGATFSINALRIGDVSNNEIIQSYDAALALQYSVSGVEPNISTPWENWRIEQADVDEDGSIKAYDASLILQHAAGMIDSFPAESKEQADAPYAGVNIEVADNTFLFKPYGNLQSLDVEVEAIDNLTFKDVKPVVSDYDNLFFSNNKTDSLAFGMAFSEAYIISDAVAEAEFIKNDNAEVTFKTVANKRAEMITVLATGVDDQISQKQIRVFPNPFSNHLAFDLQFSEPTEVTIKLFSESGRLLYTIVSNRQISGKKTFYWDNQLPAYMVPKVFIYEIQLNNKHFKGKLIRE